jgi:serine/threonine-protein kinase RsbW
LDGWGLGELADAAELLVSELLTNAVRHARTPRGRQIETRYERLAHGVRIEVHDANEELPVPRNPDEDAGSGRGLVLVEAITGGRWGVGERKGIGQLVWAVITDDGAGERSGGAE